MGGVSGGWSSASCWACTCSPPWASRSGSAGCSPTGVSRPTGHRPGFWHAHVGWAFKADPPDLDRYVKDLRGTAPVRVASALFPLWIALGLLIPAALGGILTGTWAGVLLGFVWGGLVRVFLVHHVTWSVNSVCHLWGRRPYPERDHSRNNFLLGVLALGEGWHNNHHAFPTSARHGLRWWQVDASYYVIRLLALVGLAWKVHVPAGRAVPA